MEKVMSTGKKKMSESSAAKNPAPPKSSMPQELETLVTDLRQKIAKAEVQDVGARYEIGVSVLRVIEAPQVYGQGAVKVLQEKLRQDEKTLYRYAGIAKAWPQAAMDDVRKRRNSNGLPISWSHLDTLRRVSDEAERRKLLHRWEAESLSTGELRTLVNRRNVRAKKSPEQPSASAAPSLKALAAESKHLTEALRDAAEKLPPHCENPQARLEFLHLRDALAALSAVNTDLVKKLDSSLAPRVYPNNPPSAMPTPMTMPPRQLNPPLPSWGVAATTPPPYPNGPHSSHR
jgi:hypothetical protein